MNLLIDELPVSVNIAGTEYPVNTNFRNMILIGQLVNDSAYSQNERVGLMLNLFYKQAPPDIAAAIGELVSFYKGYRPDPPVSKVKNTGAPEAYSYDRDDWLIYSAFRKSWDINLQTIEYLHWFEFRALFDDLDETCLFVKVMQYRAVDLSAIKDKEQKAFYRKMKRIYALPLDEHEQERLDKLDELLRAGGDISEVLKGC